MKQIETNNKYYIPSIEEFHVGFEYELLQTLPIHDANWGFKVKRQIFSPEHIKSTFHNVYLLDDLDLGKIRVKYLDKDDIESLGFKHEGGKLSKFGEQYFIFTKEIGINNYEHYRISLLGTKVNISCQAEGGYSNSLHHIFYGNVKNKSELQRLLKQLGIK